MFISFPMAHPQFQPSGPNILVGNQNNAAKADEVNEVGMFAIKKSPGKNPAVLISWNFIFPLEDFQNPKYKLQVEKKKANELFGHVVLRQMLESVTKLSTLPTAERANLMLTLESI